MLRRMLSFPCSSFSFVCMALLRKHYAKIFFIPPLKERWGYLVLQSCMLRFANDISLARRNIVGELADARGFIKHFVRQCPMQCSLRNCFRRLTRCTRFCEIALASEFAAKGFEKLFFVNECIARGCAKLFSSSNPVYKALSKLSLSLNTLNKVVSRLFSSLNALHGTVPYYFHYLDLCTRLRKIYFRHSTRCTGCMKIVCGVQRPEQVRARVMQGCASQRISLFILIPQRPCWYEEHQQGRELKRWGSC